MTPWTEREAPVHWRECPRCLTAGCGKCRRGYLPVHVWEIGYEQAIEEKP